MPKKQKFNFIEQIYKNSIDIDLLREYEARNILYMLQEDEDEEFSLKFITNNYNDYLSWKDDLFLTKVVELYSEETLQTILNDLIEIQNSVDKSDQDLILLDGEKKYEITKADYT